MVVRAETPGLPWWIVLIQGIAALIIGILLLVNPAATTVLLIQFLGAYWLVSGIFTLIGLFMDRSRWIWKLLSGVLGIVAGIVILANPLLSPFVVLTTLIIIVAIQGIIIGIVDLVRAFQGEGWGVGLLGILSVIFGVILLTNPVIAGVTLPFVLGIFAVVFGIAAIVMAFRLR